MGRPFLGDCDTTMQGVPPRGRPPLKKARTANGSCSASDKPITTHTAELRGQCLRKPTSERKDKRNGERRLRSRQSDTRRGTVEYGPGTRYIRMSATKRAVSRFGNGAVLFNVITNIRAQRVPPRLTPPSRRAVPQGKALETLQRDTRLYLDGLMYRPEHSDCVGIEPQRKKALGIFSDVAERTARRSL